MHHHHLLSTQREAASASSVVQQPTVYFPNFKKKQHITSNPPSSITGAHTGLTPQWTSNTQSSNRVIHATRSKPHASDMQSHRLRARIGIPFEVAKLRAACLQNVRSREIKSSVPSERAKRAEAQLPYVLLAPYACPSHQHLQREQFQLHLTFCHCGNCTSL